MSFKKTLQELQRRHVVKAGIAYLVVAWLIVQVLSILFPAFEASPNAMKTTITILGIGFPIWLVISWIYDFSPDGIKKTQAVTYDPEIHKKKNISLNRFIIGGLAIAVVLLVFNSLRLSGEVSDLRENILASNFTNSIAVLALEDRSPDKDHEYLSFGISENIYDRLIKFKDLKVTSPTSTFYYKDKDVSFDVIAQELDVSFILEGSIIPMGENYRITLRLIDSKDNSAIWSKTYDDKKENILQTYDDLANNIAQYLKLTVDEEDVYQKKVDPEAFELLLKSSFKMEKNGWTEQSIVEADSLLTRALQIDSTYAPILATKAQILFHQTVYHEMIAKNDGLKMAMIYAKRGYELDPTNVWSLVWCSNLSWHLKDMDNYQKYLEKMIELETVNAASMQYQSWCFMRTNQLDKGYPFIKKAVELNPKDADYVNQLIWYEQFYGNLDRSFELISIIQEIYPESDIWYRDNLFLYYVQSREYNKADDLIKEFNDEEFQLENKIFLEGYKGNIEYFKKNYVEHFVLTKKTTISIYNYNMACIYAFNGYKDEAFEILTNDIDAYVDYPESLFTDPDLKSLHDDPRWNEILDKLGDYFNYDFNHGK